MHGDEQGVSAEGYRLETHSVCRRADSGIVLGAHREDPDLRCPRPCSGDPVERGSDRQLDFSDRESVGGGDPDLHTVIGDSDADLSDRSCHSGT